MSSSNRLTDALGLPPTAQETARSKLRTKLRERAQDNDSSGEDDAQICAQVRAGAITQPLTLPREGVVLVGLVGDDIERARDDDIQKEVDGAATLGAISQPETQAHDATSAVPRLMRFESPRGALRIESINRAANRDIVSLVGGLVLCAVLIVVAALLWSLFAGLTYSRAANECTGAQSSPARCNNSR
jgi:hypothetical protein